MREKITFYLVFVSLLLLYLFSISATTVAYILLTLTNPDFVRNRHKKSNFVETHYYFTVTQILIVILIIMGCSRASEESVTVARARARVRVTA